jgi:PKHD-type hydroxylase
MAHLPIWYIGQVPDEECDKASAEFKAITAKNATMGAEGDVLDNNTRNTTVRFASKDHWFGKQMFQYGINANLECQWNFHLTSFEAVQHAQYGPGQHYNWHVDTFFLSGKGYDRKVTVVCLMNDPSEFEGGDLQLRFDRTEYTVPLKKGTAVAFPSFIEHRVTPVTSGIRYTSTMWINGPEFA